MKQVRRRGPLRTRKWPQFANRLLRFDNKYNVHTANRPPIAPTLLTSSNGSVLTRCRSVHPSKRQQITKHARQCRGTRHMPTHIDDLDVFEWLVTMISFYPLYVLAHVPAFRDSPEHCVLVVQPWRGHCRDEKLRSICPRPRICHRQRVSALKVARVRTRVQGNPKAGSDSVRSIMPQVSMEFIFELATPYRLATGPVAKRVASLQHKALDYAVENHAIVVPVLGMRGEVFYCLRALLWVEATVNIPHRGAQDAAFHGLRGGGVGLHHHGSARACEISQPSGTQRTDHWVTAHSSSTLTGHPVSVAR
jgi:hypothetical protein